MFIDNAATASKAGSASPPHPHDSGHADRSRTLPDPGRRKIQKELIVSIPTESFPPQSNTPVATDVRSATNGAGILPAPTTRGENDDIAPLGAPALVLGVMLIGAGLAALLKIRNWSRDYGWLVYVAYFLYMSLAGSSSVWGFRLTRNSKVPNRPVIRNRISPANTSGRSRSRTAPTKRRDPRAMLRAAG
ncbi:hypothetical protein [Nocardia xishanensis]|uniref:Uncharacterized protein n=1 Tax=Nocardia xishanensis TaxID=238964 RepID=A0ABW7X7K6_9NOCA